VSNEIEIRPVKSNKQLMDFIKLPWKIYANDPNWVPPLIMDRKKFLNRDKNPFFKDNPTEFWLAYRNDEIVGRIAAIVNHQHNNFHKDKTGFFGFLEAINDRAVFGALLNTAKDWLRERGYDNMMGPMNPSTNDECGFLIDGFDIPPYFMMTHSLPYYPEIMESLGYEKAQDLYAYYIDTDIVKMSGKLQRIGDKIRTDFPVTIRTVDMKNFHSELALIRDIYNDAWSKNWGFVPMTPAEFDYIANDFEKIIDPRLVLIGEYKGEAVGFLLGMPDYNRVFKKIPDGRLFPSGLFTFLLNKNKINTMRVITLGIKQQYQPLGLGALFYIEIVQRGPDAGYNSAEMSWVLEDNEQMNKAARLLGGKIHKTYRVYQTGL
jgi:hypothetical protein